MCSLRLNTCKTLQFLFPSFVQNLILALWSNAPLQFFRSSRFQTYLPVMARTNAARLERFTVWTGVHNEQMNAQVSSDPCPLSENFFQTSRFKQQWTHVFSVWPPLFAIFCGIWNSEKREFSLNALNFSFWESFYAHSSLFFLGLIDRFRRFVYCIVDNYYRKTFLSCLVTTKFWNCARLVSLLCRACGKFCRFGDEK